MEKLEDPNDEMKLNLDKDVLKALDPDEKIVISTLVSKYNYKGKKQERILMLTNKYVYNVALSSLINEIVSKVTGFERIRRKIPIEKISSVSLSKLSSEFVIHVPSEYDYRHSSFDKFLIWIFLFLKSLVNFRFGINYIYIILILK